jgi:hypothetical protein
MGGDLDRTGEVMHRLEHLNNLIGVMGSMGIMNFG